MSLAIVGKKIGGWTFNKWPGMQIVGGMRCRHCGKRLNNEDNIYCYAHDPINCTNMFQCSDCGVNEPHWQQLQAEIDAENKSRWEDFARTDHSVLLQRIKDAFEEGYASAEGYDVRTTLEEQWQISEAKEIYDILAKLWGVQ